MKILFIGDIVGKPGRRALRQGLPDLIDRLKTDFVIANVENAAGGFGITKTVGEEILSIGVDVMTSGNHIWDKKDVLAYIPKEDRLLRPANYPPGAPGSGSIVVKSASGKNVAVLNLAGRVFMPPLDCPFRTAEQELAALRKETDIIIVDMHAEATSEKYAMGFFLQGKVSAVIGTHTHVQTADERILAEHTAFINDVGMTGPAESIIGVKKDIIIGKFLSQVPARFETASGPAMLSGVILEVNEKSGAATSIQRLQIRFEK
jgi:hypothetical protein